MISIYELIESLKSHYSKKAELINERCGVEATERERKLYELGAHHVLDDIADILKLNELKE